MDNVTDLYAKISPLIQLQIQNYVTASVSTGTTASTAIAATELFAYSGLGLSNTDTGSVYTLILTSSSAPGAAASILASNASGGVQLTRLGVGIADSSSAALQVLATATPQLQLHYTAGTVFANVAVGSAGELTLSNTGTVAANAHLYLVPGGNVGINMATAPAAKLQIRSTTEQMRLDYSAAVYASHTVSSAGDYTIAATGTRLMTTNHLQHPTYASQLTTWRISNAGEADFRYIYTDELHAKAFIADLEQALAGGQIISKSVSKVYASFTVPTAGNTGNLDVEEFAGFAGFHVFVDGDLIRLRQFDRSGGGLKIADIWGTVVYSAQVASSNPPAQRYVFTRHATYPGTGSGTISAGTLALDYGTTGNGYLEQNAIDGLAGANSPYYQIVTWATHPKSVAGGEGLQLRVRLGQLRGLTGANQWGLYAGTGWTANPNEGNVTSYTVTTPTVNDQHRYIIAGDNGVQIYNADLNIYSSTTPVITLNRTTPYLAIGSASDAMTFTAGNAGFWVGNVSGTYKMRLGSVSGGVLSSGLSWDGSALRVIGSAYIGNGVGFSVAPLLYCAFDTPQGSTVPNLNGHLGQVATYSGPITGTSGGKFHGALYLEEGTTNLITNNSFETNLTGVTANGGTITQSSTYAVVGTYSMRTTGAASGQGWYYNVASVTSVSTQYTWSVYVRGTGAVRLFFYGAAGYVAALNVTLTSTFTRYSLTYTFLSGDTTRLVGVEQNGAGTTDWYTDAVQLEQKAYVTSYAATSRTVSIVQYAAANNFNQTTCTLSGWFFLSALTGRTCTFFGGDNSASLTVYCTASAVVVSRKDTANVISYSIALSALAWHHIAVTVSSGTVTNLYINGALVATATAGSAYATPTYLMVGSYNTSGGFNVNGYIDDFASINRVLTADEITSIYTANAPLQVTRSNYELMLANTSTAGYMIGNASGLYGYSDTSGAAGTGAFALVTTAGTVMGTQFGSETLGAGDMMIGSATAGYSNLLFTQSTGRLAVRLGTTDRVVMNSSGAFGIKDSGGTNNVLLFTSGGVNQIAGRLDLTATGSITAGTTFDDVILDSTGITMKAPTAYADINSMKWKYSTTKTGEIYSLVDIGTPVSGTLVIRGRTYSGGTNGYVDIGAVSSSSTAIQHLLSGVPNSATRGPHLRTQFYNTSSAVIGGQIVYCSTAGTNADVTGAGSVRYRMHYRLVVRASGGGVATLTGDLGVNANTTVTVGGTASDFRVGVHSDGHIFWDRITGAETYEVTFWAIYI